MHARCRPLLLVLMLLSGACPLVAQPLRDEKGYAVVFPRSGEGFAANVLRSDPDTLVLFTNDFKYVAKKDIAKIVLHSHRTSAEGFWVGSVVGLYVSNLVFGTASRQTGAFLSKSIYGSGYSAGPDLAASGIGNSGSPLAPLGITAAGFLAGGGIGWAIENDAAGTITFEFVGDPSSVSEEWERFDHELVSPRRDRPWRLSITGASVFSTIARAYRQRALDAGLTINNYLTSSVPPADLRPFSGSVAVDPIAQDASDFNWGRTLSLSYRVLPKMEVGLAWTWLGEPTFGAYYGKVLAFPPDPNIITQRRLSERLDAKGYYATSSFVQTFSLRTGVDLEVRATAGIGLAKVDFDVHGEQRIDSESVPVVFNAYTTSIHKLHLLAMGSVEVSYYFYDLFSVGLEASYYYAGSGTAGQMPYMYIDEQPLSFGNADIGFTIGIHL